MYSFKTQVSPATQDGAPVDVTTDTITITDAGNTDLVLVAAAVEHEAEVGEMKGCEQAQARVRRQNAQRPLKQHYIALNATRTLSEYARLLCGETPQHLERLHLPIDPARIEALTLLLE